MEELERNGEKQSGQCKNTAESKTEQQTIALEQLTCPRCGKQFNLKEKKCPHCGLKNNLKLCKTCGATIAKNAKRCPKCGAKNKKPFYKRVMFWGIVIIFLFFMSCTASNDNMNNAADTGSSTMADKQDVDSDIIVGTWLGEIKINGAKNEAFYLDKSQNVRLTVRENKTIAVGFGDDVQEYLWDFVGENNGVWQYKIVARGDTSGKSIEFIYIDEDNKAASKEWAGKIVVMSGDNTVIYGRVEDDDKASESSLGATGNYSGSNFARSKVSLSKQNALQKANEYLNAMAFSYSGLIEQLEYEGFSTEDATYAVDNCGANWKEQAAKKAKEYLNTMAFSRSSLIDQLEYEGFTAEQATYGVEQNGY